jgi:hypothetical protein
MRGIFSAGRMINPEPHHPALFHPQDHRRALGVVLM